MKRLVRYFIYIIIVAAIVGGGSYAWRKFYQPKTHVIFNTEPAQRSDIASTTSATGTVEPEELVNVGAQVGGMIIEFGKDDTGKPIDYGSRVKQGIVLARIDDALYKAAFEEAEALRLQAEASIASAEAGIQQSEAKLELAELNWNRARELQPKGSVSKSDYDNALSAFHTAQAGLSVSKAEWKQAKAKFASAKASLSKASRNLGYCIIRSPVDGVIIDRRVSIGQTVVSSMSAPSLFLIAKDLKKMQVWVSVNEADIGNIREGMDVTFSVDAFPDQEFRGSVRKIRLNATMSQNVVTYVVEVSTDNSSGKLLPYLTASVQFIRERRANVLTVPNAALRYIPELSIVPEQYRSVVENAIANPGAARHGQKNAPGERMLWVLNEGTLHPVRVVTGLTDGIITEITGGDLQENDIVVSGATIVSGEASKSEKISPFIPVRRRKKR